MLGQPVQAIHGNSSTYICMLYLFINIFSILIIHLFMNNINVHYKWGNDGTGSSDQCACWNIFQSRSQQFSEQMNMHASHLIADVFFPPKTREWAVVWPKGFSPNDKHSKIFKDGLWQIGMDPLNPTNRKRSNIQSPLTITARKADPISTIHLTVTARKVDPISTIHLPLLQERWIQSVQI